jgi:hypothetical protein
VPRAFLPSRSLAVLPVHDLGKKCRWQGTRTSVGPIVFVSGRVDVHQPCGCSNAVICRISNSRRRWAARAVSMAPHRRLVAEDVGDHIIVASAPRHVWGCHAFGCTGRRPPSRCSRLRPAAERCRRAGWRGHPRAGRRVGCPPWWQSVRGRSSRRPSPAGEVDGARSVARPRRTRQPRAFTTKIRTDRTTASISPTKID